MGTKDAGKFYSRNIPKKQISDSGMAFVLILLLIGLFTDKVIYYKLAIPVLVVNMTVPIIFYPFSVIWYALADLLGMIMSKVILTIVFIVFIIPVSFIRKLMGKDTLRLKDFKKSKKTVMIKTEHGYVSADIEKPY